MMFNSQLYAEWLTQRDLTGVSTPDADGYFRRGDQRCVLPVVRAYWIRSRKQREQDPSCMDNPPLWKPETWRKLGDGWMRYLRADQALDFIASYGQPEENEPRFNCQVRRALTGGRLRSGWQTPVDTPLLRWPELLARRVESLRIEEIEDGWTKKKSLLWTRIPSRFPLVMRYGAPRALVNQVRRLGESIAEIQKAIDRESHPEARDRFADELGRMVNLRAEQNERIERLLSTPGIHIDRETLSTTDAIAALLEEQFARGKVHENASGVDAVHTPESKLAGLSGYLCEGFHISDEGTLQSADRSTFWGPSTTLIPHFLSNAPRRLMLGAALQAKAVPVEFAESPHDIQSQPVHLPPGCNLRVAFSVGDGYTHEDAFVVSESAARKLSRAAVDECDIRLLVPSVVSRVVYAEPGPVAPGTQLVRAYIDLFALGWRRHELSRLRTSDGDHLGAENGWLQIAIPGSRIGLAAEVLEVKQRSFPGTFWCEEITFRLRRDYGGPRLLSVGDKLATRHGIKGVVGRILPDDAMPMSAEILLSSEGVLRRQAMGQFREAAGGEVLSALPESGNIFVLRQPQDAADALRVCGRRQVGTRGQRYGWMEFAALMAHGATAIAQELLSVSRSTAGWMKWESECRDLDERLAGWASHTDPLYQVDHRRLARAALNRYLSAVGVRIESQQFVFPRTTHRMISVLRPSSGFEVPLYRSRAAEEVLENLSDPAWWKHHRGIVYLNFGDEPLSIVLQESGSAGDKGVEPTESVEGDEEASQVAGSGLQLDGKKGVKITFHAFHLLPPWLRPESELGPHPLTKFYRELLRRCQNQKVWEQTRWPRFSEATARPKETQGSRLIRRGLSLTFSAKEGGAEAFVKRDVLGRRLTRSARAVIVPDPGLRIDEIRLPKSVAESILKGLMPAQQKRVLVHRNPLLQRRGLLALKPIIDETDAPVFGLPLGILSVMGADFDGDTVCVVALETEEAMDAAVLMSPGARNDLRTDPFRNLCPAFPLLHELRIPDEERVLASVSLDELNPREWCKHFESMLRRRIESLGSDGWPSEQRTMDAVKKLDHLDTQKGNAARRYDLYQGTFESHGQQEWLDWARSEMMKVYGTVPAKGRLGGVLRNQMYRLSHDPSDFEGFRNRVEACQAVTERLTQSALDVKTGKGASQFSAAKFFESPQKYHEALLSLDGAFDVDAVCNALGDPRHPTGILWWLQKPSLETLVKMITERDQHDASFDDDPRVNWYL